MTTGSTTTFEQTRDQIIADALTKLGANGPDGSPSGSQVTHAARALNRLVKSLDPEGNFLWRVVERTATTTAGTVTFTPSADVLAIDEPMNFMRSGTTSRMPMRAISRDDWMSLADRTTQGAPAMYYVSKALSGLTVNLVPVPDASGDTITYSAVLKSKDYVTGANTSDFPAEWTRCLVLGLTSDLAFDYAQPQLAAQLDSLFQNEKDRLLEEGTEQGNLMLVPFGSYGGGW